MKLLERLDRALAKVEEILLALILVGMVVLAAIQVLLRNIWDTGIDWGDPAVQNATVLVGLLGAAIATSEGRHLNIDAFSRNLSGRARHVLAVVIGLFSVAVCAALAVGGWETYRANYLPWLEQVPAGWTAGKLLREELLEGTVPQWLSQLMLPVGFALIGVHFGLRLVRDLHVLVTGRAPVADGSEVALEGDALLDAMAARVAEEAPAGGAEGQERAPERARDPGAVPGGDGDGEPGGEGER